MGMYRDKLGEAVPVVKRMLQKKGEMICCSIMMEQWRKEYYETVYLKPVWNHLENGDGIIYDKCYFLVTDEESVGVKAAFAVLNYPLFEAEQESQNISRSMMFFKAKNEYDGWLRGGSGKEAISYFTGLNEENMNELELKMQCIMSCDSRIRFVQIKEEYLSRPWVRELLEHKESEIICLPKMTFDYYMNIMEWLLKGERYRLDSALKKEQIVRNIQKKCSDRFCEEEVAWSLDQAEKSAIARDDFRSLKPDDFRLDVYDYASPMKKLNEMIGLEAVKTLAHEYAALSREQMRNVKVSNICKHVVFVGRPGTGKTMCGELLAQIMAEHGQSNGNFIVASRKDIVAEYVGQTAPKVAKLFTQARKGVLFVDEAGFLLHDQKGSFNQEAIKEFVRYMELYQDVMVIFALYPGEAEEFLKLDAGLRSRISRVIPFEDYSEKELFYIVRRMCEDRGYKMSENTEEIIREYLQKQRRLLGEEFGNAREGRKLVESAVIARSMRCYDDERKEEEPILIAEDFAYGIRRLEQGRGKQKALAIGFA